jgi:GNAT superfamily N-acetyltransferase
MDFSNIVFQKLTFEQLQELISWAEKEGWNPGKQDAEIFWSTDPDGYYGIFLNNEMIGGGALVSYDGKFGSMGLFIVKPEHRGGGYGNHLWYKRRDTLLARLDPGAAIGMDGVVPMQPFYAKGGFSIAFKDMRYEKTGSSFETDTRITELEEKDVENIKEYDFVCMGYHRNKFLEPWIKQAVGKTFVFKEDGELKGYAVIREAVSGLRIGPLFADHFEAAESLYKACLNFAENKQVFIDIPYSQPQVVTLLEKYDAHPIFECARMYYGKHPILAIDKIYGLTSLELG